MESNAQPQAVGESWHERIKSRLVKDGDPPVPSFGWMFYVGAKIIVVIFGFIILKAVVEFLVAGFAWPH